MNANQQKSIEQPSGLGEFDIKERGLKYWADPGQTREGQINRHDGGRGVYFEDASGHLLEIITRSYGSGE